MCDVDTPVLILAAGPAGLLSSNLLSRHSVRHVQVDCHPACPVIFGSPRRFEKIASQLEQFVNVLGGLSAHMLPVDKVYNGFTASSMGSPQARPRTAGRSPPR
jgi:hypothetical protein